MTLPTIFLDMDGPMTDFVGDALKVHGASDAINDWPPGEYNMAKVLGISTHEFWRPINATGEAFWAKMTPAPRMHGLMAIACDKEWYIASSPSQDPACASGKLKWLGEHINQGQGPFRHYVFTPHKHLLAASGRILIDDSDAEIAAWFDLGGEGVLWPTLWNSDHEYADDPLARVVLALRQIGVEP